MASRRWTYRALLLLALCARAAGNDIKIGDGLYSGGSLDFKINQTIDPGVVTICITGYAPFMYYTSDDCAAELCEVAELKHALPTRNNAAGLARGYYTKPVPAGLPGGACPAGGCPPNWISSDDPKLVGFDRDFIALIFGKMLNLPYTFRSYGSFPEFKMAVLQGMCDVGITASEVDPVAALCDGFPKVSNADTYDYAYGDYAASEGVFGNSDDSIKSSISCLQYGLPYITSGFALLSMVSTKPFDLSSSVFNNDMLNCFSVMVLISMACGYAACMLERKNMHLGTLPRGAYWAIMSFLQVSENEPVRKKGRLLMILMLCGNILGMQVLGAIMGAKLTTTALTIVKIDKLSDVTGMLCVEENYDVLQRYVQRQPDRPSSIIYDSREECVRKLLAKEVVAVMTDVTTLQWIASYAQISGASVSPVLQANPLAFIYSNYSGGLQRYLDPAVSAATLTDMDWMPFTEALKGTYFGLQEPGESTEENPIHLPSAIAALILLVLPLPMALLNGDLGPGIFKDAESGWKYRVRKMISQPTAKEDAVFMSDKEGALQGHDTSFFRFAVTKLEDILGEMTMLRGSSAAFELLSLNAPADAPSNKGASKASASGDVAAVLATMLGPVLQELREVKQQLDTVQHQNAELAEMLVAQGTQGGHGTGCFGGGAKPAVPPTPIARRSSGAEPALADSRDGKLLDSVAVDVSARSN